MNRLQFVEPSKLTAKVRVAAVALALTIGAVLTLQLASAPASTQEAAPADEATPEATPAKKPARKVKQARAEQRRSIGALPHPALNICSLNRQTIIQNAEINVASAKRLEELRQQAQSELNKAQQALVADYKALNDARLPPTEAEFKSRKLALETRSQSLVALVEIRRRQIDITRAEVSRQISVAALPILQGVEKEKACTLLLAQEGVLDGTGLTDITPLVIKAMNAQLHPAPFQLAAVPPR